MCDVHPETLADWFRMRQAVAPSYDDGTKETPRIRAKHSTIYQNEVAAAGKKWQEWENRLLIESRDKGESFEAISEQLLVESLSHYVRRKRVLLQVEQSLHAQYASMKCSVMPIGPTPKTS